MKTLDFGELYERYWPDVYRFCVYLCGNPTAAKDIASETFVRAWTVWDRIRVETVKAYAAATDNVGVFFGEDIFFAIGSIVLIQQILAGYGYNLAPLELALWAIPSAICAFLIHSTRLILLDRKLGRRGQ